eukprot:6541806-Pyramimonas_sp.AAC.1
MRNPFCKHAPDKRAHPENSSKLALCLGARAARLVGRPTPPLCATGGGPVPLGSDAISCRREKAGKE